jgi:hypothetical protein
VEGAHRFGYCPTGLAGGEPGELGGLIHNTPGAQAHYADRVGQLSLDEPLAASGRIALNRYGPDGAFCIGWFNNRGRGYPPADVLGFLVDGPTGTGPSLRGMAAPGDARLAHIERESPLLVPPDGASHTWRIDYDPAADGGRGRVSLWLDDRLASFSLPAGLREHGATFDRFGLFSWEGGGRSSIVYLDDLQYTARRSR